MIALFSGTHLQQLQTQFVFLFKDALLQGLHLSGRDMVDVHAHGGTHPTAAFQ